MRSQSHIVVDNNWPLQTPGCNVIYHILQSQQMVDSCHAVLTENVDCDFAINARRNISLCYSVYSHWVHDHHSIWVNTPMVQNADFNYDGDPKHDMLYIVLYKMTSTYIAEEPVVLASDYPPTVTSIDKHVVWP